MATAPEIRRRPSVALRQAKAALDALLQDQIDAINADLALEAAGYRLPDVATNQSEATLTSSTFPERELRIKLEVSPGYTPPPRTSGQQFSAQLELIITVEIPKSSLEAQAAEATLTIREQFAYTASDMLYAIWRALHVYANTDSLVGNAGVYMTGESRAGSYAFTGYDDGKTPRSVKGELRLGLTQNQQVTP